MASAVWQCGTVFAHTHTHTQVYALLSEGIGERFNIYISVGRCGQTLEPSIARTCIYGISVLGFVGFTWDRLRITEENLIRPRLYHIPCHTA